jgi:hypothetical protein
MLATALLLFIGKRTNVFRSNAFIAYCSSFNFFTWQNDCRAHSPSADDQEDRVNSPLEMLAQHPQRSAV